MPQRLSPELTTFTPPAPSPPTPAVDRGETPGEQHLRDFLRNANYLIQSTAPDGRLLFVNAAWTRALGYTLDDVARGLNMLDILDPACREACQATFARVNAGETLADVEAVFVARDGRRVLVAGETNARLDEAGRAIATRGIFRDVTAQRAAEAEARLLETRFQAMFDVLGEGVTLVRNTHDGDAIIEAANASAERILGVDARRMLGWRLLEFPWRTIGEDGREIPRERHPTLVALATGEPQQEVVLGVRRGDDGRRVWISVSARPLFRPDEPRPYAAVSSFRDVTEARLVAARLAASEERYRHLFEGSDAAQLIVDAETGCVADANPAALLFYGYSRAEFVDRPLDSVCERAPAGVGGGRPNTRWRHRLATGEVRDVDVYTTLTAVDDRAVLHQVVHDVTERVRAEAELALLQQVTQAVSAADDETTAFLVALESMCAATGWAYGEVWVPEARAADGGANAAPRPVLAHGPAWCHTRDPALTALAAASAALRFAPNEGLPGRVWAERGPVWLADSAAARPAAPGRTSLTVAAGLRMGVGIPVLADDDVVAVLTFHAPESRPEDGRRVQLLATVAAQIGALIARKRADDARRESDRRLRATLEGVHAAAVTLDVAGRVTFANDFLLELTGWTRDEVLGVNWFERFVPEGHDVTGVFSEMIARGEVPAHFENEIVTRAGARRTISWDSTVLRDDAGRVVGTASLGQDVTDRARLTRLKDELIGVASHELRTPLSAIHGALALLAASLGAGLGERDARLLDIAARNTQMLTRLVNDLLDVERIESGAAPLSPEDVRAGALLGAVVDLMQPLAERAAITLRVAGADGRAWADVDRVVQVLTNLIGNAIKFTAAGGAVTLAAEVDAAAADEIRFSVRDTGRGIPPDKLESIFERFEQVSAADARDKGGAGLGLAICRAIVRQHGGRIWAESVPGEGSVLRFTLPAAPA